MHVKCRPSDRVRFDSPAESLRAPVVVHLHRVRALEVRSRVRTPYKSLAAFVAIAILAGMLAAILPARRASKLNVLEALQYE
jgi:hypothetical protein